MNALAREMGVKERQAQRYLAELQARKFITAFARFRSPNIRDTNGYVFLWHETFTGSIRRPGTPVSNVTPPPASHQTPPLVSDMTPKESHPEESPRQESQSSSSTVEKGMKTPPPTPSPRRIQTPEINSSGKKTDDDDGDRATEQTKAQYKSDHEELMALIEQATGQPADCKLIGDILDRLKLRETPLREYLDDIRPRLKRLKRRAGPGFFYLQACDPGRSKPAAREAQRPQTNKCQQCSGIGKTPEGVYCDCSMGRDLARVEKRLARKNVKSEAAA